MPAVAAVAVARRRRRTASGAVAERCRSRSPPCWQRCRRAAPQVTASGASAELSDAWRSKVLPLCQAAFNRYPFVAGSTQDVPLDDFVHLLGPGGLMDQFFDQYLKPFVDNSQTPWKWQSADHTHARPVAGALVEFQRAARYPRCAVRRPAGRRSAEVPAGAGDARSGPGAGQPRGRRPQADLCAWPARGRPPCNGRRPTATR